MCVTDCHDMTLAVKVVLNPNTSNVPTIKFRNILDKINPFPNKPWFLCLQHKSLENAEGKGEIAQKEQYLLFPQCFLPIWRTFCHFHQVQNCRLQNSFCLESQKFVVLERVKNVFKNDR